MALFSRRILQGMVNDISAKIRRRDLKAIVNRLNLPNSQAIDAQYELAVILGLSQSGEISYEPDLGGSSRPDILFRAEDGVASEFIADVTCLSQKNLSSRVSYDFLTEEFERLLAPHGIGIGGFNFQIGSKEEGIYGDQKLTLKIPGNREITRLLETEVPLIASAIHQDRDKPQKFDIDRGGLEVEITYKPGGLFVGGGYRPDGLPRSLEHNPVFQSLENKAVQLEKAGYTGIRGIFLCDTGSDLVQGNFHPEPFSLEDILREFFQNHREIAFICTCYSAQVLEQQSAGFGSMNLSGPYRITGNFFPNPDPTHPVPEALKNLICDLPKGLPITESNGLNAQNWIAAHPEPYGRSHIGGLKMAGDMVRFSARALQELLAGHIDQERFFRAHGFVPDEINKASPNPFDTALKRGRLIAKIEVESDPESDDDWIVMYFGDRDPAISKISVPNVDT